MIEKILHLLKEKTRVPKNWDFIAHINKNSDDIAPDFAYDDGVFTYLGFWHTKTIPSVFIFGVVFKSHVL